MTFKTSKKTASALTKAYGDFIDQWSGEDPWTVFITCTCPAGENRTTRSWRRSMIRTMQDDYLDGVYTIKRGFWALERHKSGQVHAHALVQFVDVYGQRFDETDDVNNLATNMWEVLFRRFGRSQVLPFDPKLGAAYYVTKYCTKGVSLGNTDWDIYMDGDRFPI